MHSGYLRLGRFAKLRKEAISYVMSVCPSAWKWMDCHEIWHLRVFLKFVEKARVSLKSDKNNGYFR